MSEDYSDIFANIARAKKTSNFAPKLEVGKHRLIISKYGVKPSQKGGGPIIEAEFVVLTSTTIAPGETRGHAWFISGAGYSGSYQQSYAKEFLQVVGKCCGSDASENELGKMLASETQPANGILIDLEVRAQLGKKKDGTAKANANGDPYTDFVWKAVATESQDPESYKAKMLAGFSGTAPVVAQAPAAPVMAAAPAAVMAAAAAAPAPAGGGILGNLMSRK